MGGQRGQLNKAPLKLRTEGNGGSTQCQETGKDYSITREGTRGLHLAMGKAQDTETGSQGQ